MIVYFSFDDDVSFQYYKMYESLFIDRRRTNPNLSPYRMTMFVSHEYTDYHLLSLLHNLGHEAACHTVNHIDLRQATTEQIAVEIGDQVKNINELVGVPSGEVRGFRAPFLSFTGRVYPILKEFGLLYDSSVTTKTPQNPTYNIYGYGIWNVPMSVFYINGRYCAMFDGCRPKNEKVAFRSLWRNFKRHRSQKIPFGINMHAALFLGWDFTLTAMHKFLDRLDEMDDVWVVPMYKMIQWMENPTPLGQIHTFPPFVR